MLHVSDAISKYWLYSVKQFLARIKTIFYISEFKKEEIYILTELIMYIIMG